MNVNINGKILSLIKGDITNQSTDAIVNASKPSLDIGSGVNGAIHRAGGPTIIEQCRKIVQKQGKLPTGKAVITIGGKLKAAILIHDIVTIPTHQTFKVLKYVGRYFNH